MFPHLAPLGFPVAHGAADVLRHQPSGVLGTTLGYRSRDLAMLFGVILLPARYRAAPGEESPSLLDKPQRLEDPYHLLVAGGTRERDVEVAAGVVGCDPATRPLLARDRAD